MTEDTRYPYTQAYDFIRNYGINPAINKATGEKLMTRSCAALIVNSIAKVIGMDDEELAKKLADRFLEMGKEDE